jgi:hypothetical protein
VQSGFSASHGRERYIDGFLGRFNGEDGIEFEISPFDGVVIVRCG